jgi:large subunit ribosomal protein L25
MNLEVQIRNEKGRRVKDLRRQGLIPAELYGKGIENMHLAVKSKDFKNVFKEAGESSIINIVVSDKNKKEEIPVLIHNIQKDYLTDDIIHIDFYRVRMDEKIRTHIPLEFVGESPAVKNYGGILNKSMFEIEIEALPKDLPHNISVDISQIKELDQSIYVKDLSIPKNVKILVDPETVIATVSLPKEEAPSESIDVSAVKVETEEKKLERSKEKEAETEEK